MVRCIEGLSTRFGCGQVHSWPWVKIQIVPPVSIPIPTKIGSKMGGAPTPKWDPMGFDNHSLLRRSLLTPESNTTSTLSGKPQQRLRAQNVALRVPPQAGSLEDFKGKRLNHRKSFERWIRAQLSLWILWGCLKEKPTAMPFCGFPLEFRGARLSEHGQLPEKGS